MLLRWSVALLPELLYEWNTLVLERGKKPSSSLSSLSAHQATVQLDIASMGCVACINSIDSALKQTPGVIEVSSSLNPLGMKGGQAMVRVQATSSRELDHRLSELCQAVRQTGFEDCSIASVQRSL